MRAIWKGAISFGLVSIPVRLYTATEERDVSFHQVRRSDGSRIRYRRVAEADGQEVPYSEIAKGYELPSGEVVIVTDEDLADLPLATARVIDVVSFVPLEQVDPIYFAKSYYLEPDGVAAKPYALLRDALQRSEMVGLVKVAIRSRESLGTVRVRDGVLVLETMVWPDEVRRPDFAFLDDDVAVRPQELAMAESLIESMTADFDPNQYHDDYREALQQVIEAKIEGRELVEPVAEAAPEGAVADLMAALRASVAAAKRSRGEAVEEPGSAGPAAVGGRGTSKAAGTEPAKSGPAKSASVKSASVKSAPVKSAPVKSAPVKSAPVKTLPPAKAAKSGAPAKTAKAKAAAEPVGAADGPGAAKAAPAKKAVKKTATRRSA